ncbi:Os03g0714800 [Oryza sativa Japonica Group]|uniref:Os03g0714800 protein n=1 Tax=Oryza sativa subsp. japonica TaxID=39947 RepID=Q0DP49_ORYSJ|nr:Os03g0714800 [Oryza sativa Japonica Group]|eukprot:NP_001051075.2 Os03g0714800 [Oryza sativa Japonica Group]
MESETEGQQFDDMDAMLRNGLGFNDFNAVEGDGDVGEHSEDAEKFYKLAADASQDLYPGSKMSKLQFIIKLLHGMKTCYLGHRRFLPQNHSFRFDEKSFDGTKELRDAPVQPSGHDILKETENLNVVFGKAEKKKRKRKDDDNNDGGSTVIWKKRSCFFRLPYWEHLLVRHNLDIMHIEKNVCDNIVNTLLNVDRKSKDNLNSRLDLQSLGIKQDMHPVMQGTKVFLPPTAFSLSAHEKKLFYQVQDVMAKGENPSKEIQILAKGPDMHVITYNSYLINGYNFRTKSCDEGKSTQRGIMAKEKVSGGRVEINKYELQRMMQIERNNEVLVQHLPHLAGKFKMNAQKTRQITSNMPSKSVDFQCHDAYFSEEDVQDQSYEENDLRELSEADDMDQSFEANMDSYDGKNVKLKVDYNEHFQPVGPYASKLANVIGNLAKGKFLSLAYEDWTDVPNKDDVWDNVKARSNRGKANRAKMVAVHTIGTRSLANVRHDMEKKKGRKVSRAEVFKVAYTRKDGRPQPAHEVTIIQPRIVEALQLNQKRPAMKVQPRIARELQLNLNKHARKVQPRIVEESQLNHNRHDGMVQPGVARESQVNQNMHVTKGVQKHMARYNNNKPTEIEGANVGTTKHANVKRAALACENVVGRDVFLKRIVRPYNRVARATIQSQDPLEMVGGTMLGRECYKVVIDSLICGDAELFRPHRNLNYIRDAIGHCIAWPSQLVEEVSPQCNGEVTKTGL